MKHQSRPEREPVVHLVVGDGVGVHHLRNDLLPGIHREQGVVHHETEGARHIGRREVRIDDANVRLDHRRQLLLVIRLRMNRHR
ncbi:MAG: hypothetical protein QM766_14165 [Burkholderiaceae bacterium]